MTVVVAQTKLVTMLQVSTSHKLDWNNKNAIIVFQNNYLANCC